MRITVFTSNQPRHLALVEALRGVAEEVWSVHECNTVFPGQVPDFFRHTPTMQSYMGRVMAAEREVFGTVRFLPDGARAMPLRMGDLNRIPLENFGAALDADLFVVFGASYIKGPLIDHLVERRALNIHMGLSPFYRGSSCNFWALHDGRPEYVGATIHLLTRGLDSGAMLRHAVPAAGDTDPFVLGMRAVKAAHEALVDSIRRGELDRLAPVAQEKAQELRYSRHAEFTDEVAQAYLEAAPSPGAIGDALRRRDLSILLRPYVGGE
jgi:hypothetical protein